MEALIFLDLPSQNPDARFVDDKQRQIRSFLVELAVYAVLVVGYFYLVLHFLGEWIKAIYDKDKTLYAAVALGLMLGQGLVLEMVTTFLLKVIRDKTE